MKRTSALGIRWGVAVAGLLAMAGVSSVQGVTAQGVTAQGVTAKGVGSVVSPAAAPAEREIVDPSLGNRWLLARDPRHPGGPGMLILADTRSLRDGREAAAAPLRRLSLAVRAGDLLRIEQHTQVMDAEFEAIALEPAREGAPLRARLRAGGARIRVIALGGGRAQLAAEAQP